MNAARDYFCQAEKRTLPHELVILNGQVGSRFFKNKFRKFAPSPRGLNAPIALAAAWVICCDLSQKTQRLDGSTRVRDQLNPISANDFATADDIGKQAAAVNPVLDDRRRRKRLAAEVLAKKNAGFTQLNAAQSHGA